MNYKISFQKLHSFFQSFLKRKTYHLSLSILLLSLLFFLSVFPNFSFLNTSTANSSTSSATSTSVSSNLISHQPITISGNQGFSSCGCISGGDGSSGNPFIIHNFYITKTTGIGINITGTSAFFKIQNVWVDGFTGSYPSGSGIYLDNVMNGLLTNNTASHNDLGIVLVHSANITLTHNTIRNNNYSGFFNFASNSTTYSDNHVLNNNQGFNDGNSHNNTIIGNFLVNNTDGLASQYTSNDFIVNNSALSNKNSFLIYYSSHNSITQNRVNNSRSFGIYLYSDSYMQISFNSVDNSSVGFMADSGSTFNSFFNNSATNNAVDGFRFLSSNNNTCSNNSALYNAESGFSLTLSQYNNLTSNYAAYNIQYGLDLESAYHNTIENNTFQLNSLNNIISYSSSGTILANNNITNPAVPSPPLALQANATIHGVILSWEVPKNDSGYAINSYFIYRSRFDSRSYSLIGTTKELSFNDTSYSAFQAYPFYYYIVRASNSIGLSMSSNQVNITVSNIPLPSTIISHNSKQTTFSNPFVIIVGVISLYSVKRFRNTKK